MIKLTTLTESSRTFRNLYKFAIDLKIAIMSNDQLDILKLKNEMFQNEFLNLKRIIPVKFLENSNLSRHCHWLNRRMNEGTPEDCLGDIKDIVDQDIFAIEELFIKGIVDALEEPMNNLQKLEGMKQDLFSNNCEALSWITIAEDLLKDIFPGEKINLKQLRTIPLDMGFTPIEQQRFNKLLENYISRAKANIKPSKYIYTWNMIHPIISDCSRERFDSSQYSDAVEAAFKEVNNIIKKEYKLKLNANEDGDVLMKKAFSPTNPIFNLASPESSDYKSIQQGYMEIFAGAMKGIRNPKAHSNLKISIEDAWEKIVLASHLLKIWDARIKE